MDQGYVKVYRQLLDNPVVCKDADHFTIWGFLLLKATHAKIDFMFAGKRIALMPGQLITGRKTIADKFNISESKVQRVLKTFEIEQMIEQQTSNKNRLITVKNWCEYQSSEQQNEQPVNNKRTTTEQQLNTNKNVKNDKNERNNIYVPDGTDNYQSLFDYYLTLGLVKHRKLTKEMRNAIDIARRRNEYTWDELRTLLLRHKNIVNLTKDDNEYAVRPRGITEFFGQKVKDGTALICSEYADGGAKQQWYSQKYIKGNGKKGYFDRPTENYDHLAVDPFAEDGNGAE